MITAIFDSSKVCFFLTFVFFERVQAVLKIVCRRFHLVLEHLVKTTNKETSLCWQKCSDDLLTYYFYLSLLRDLKNQRKLIYKLNETKLNLNIKCLMLNFLKLNHIRTKLTDERKKGQALNNYLPSFILRFFPKGTTPVSTINKSNFPLGEITLFVPSKQLTQHEWQP